MFAHHGSQQRQRDMRTDDAIRVYGFKWAYMMNNKYRARVIPVYICDVAVAQPVLSATRLAEQGFEITLSEQPTIKHTNRI